MNTFGETVPAARFTFFAAALLAFLSLAPTETYALTTALEMTPASLEQSGFSMNAANQEDGMVELTLIRDLSKARSFPPESDLQVRRSATLQVFGKAGLLVECDIEQNKQKNTITYRFVIARDYVAHSHFSLAEIDDYKDPSREHLIGGRTLFNFSLALYTKRPSSERAP